MAKVKMKRVSDKVRDRTVVGARSFPIVAKTWFKGWSARFSLGPASWAFRQTWLLLMQQLWGERPTCPHTQGK